MKPSLDGIRLKIARAQHHLDEVNATLAKWNSPEQKSHHTIFKPDFKRQRIVGVASRLKPLDPMFPIIVGDCIHNLRSALDHLVYQLAIANGQPVSRAEKTKFPIVFDPTKWSDERKSCKPYIATHPFTVIESLQPYKTRNEAGVLTPEQNVLGIIHKLNIIDKHRVLVIVEEMFSPQFATISIDGGKEISIPISSQWQPLKDSTVVADFDVSGILPSPDAKVKMRVKTKTEVDVFFADTKLICDGESVTTYLMMMIDVVTEVIDLFEQHGFK